MQWLPATLHNSRWMYHCEVYHGSIEAISILDPVGVVQAYSHIALRYHSEQWHVRSYASRDATFAEQEDSMEGRLVHHCEVSSAEAVQILHRSDSNDWHASHWCTYHRFFPEVAIVLKVGQVNGYQSWGQDILYYPIPIGLSEVLWEWIRCQTSVCASQWTRKLTEQQSRLLSNGIWILSIILWSIWFVQRWWRIRNA